MISYASYVKSLADALDKVDCAAFDALAAALRDVHGRDGMVLICGNGGSAATASHMVNDLVKAPSDASGCRPFRAVGLSDCVPLMTAYANDVDYASAFSKQIEALGRKGDLLIAFSGSGNSPNVLEAARAARRCGMTAAGLTGFEGGRLKDLVDIHINVPCGCMAQIEDAHLIIEHAVVEVLKEAFGGVSGARPAAPSAGAAPQ